MTTETETGLSVLESSKFLAVRPNSQIAEALKHNFSTGETMTEKDLTRVKVPAGGITSWTVPGIRGEEQADELVGALVYYGLRGVLWGHEEVKGEGTLPVLVSDDLRWARRVSDDPGDLDPAVLDAMRVRGGPKDGMYDWRGPDEGGPNEFNDWGTSQGGKRRGKRAKESRVLCLLLPNEAFPLLINATPGSLKTVAPFVKKLPAPHFQCVVRLKLEKVQAQPVFSRIVPTLVEVLSNDEGAALKQLYTDKLQNIVKNIVPDAAEYGAGDE